MAKVCLIQKELKDKNFSSGAEQIDFQILKSLAESDYELEVFCQNNNLSKKIKSTKVLELSEEYFFQTAFSTIIIFANSIGFI